MVTLNKNGKPRKQGSGRKKGSTSLVSVRLSDLKKSFNDDDLIVCGRVFFGESWCTDYWKGYFCPPP